MTSIPSIPSDDYPTEWRLLDEEKMVEFRRVAMDTYSIRNENFQVTVNTEGFNLYREGPSGDFQAWIKEHGIQAVALYD